MAEKKAKDVKAVVKPAKKAEKTVDFTKMGEKELQEQLAGMRKDLGDFRRSLAHDELVNPRVIASTKKQIARALTQLNSKSKEAKSA